LSLARIWDKRVASWHTHVTSTSGFDKVLDRLLAIADPGPDDACVDLGAGAGFVALALAPLAGSVLAVDISPVMAESLAAHAGQAGLRNVRIQVADLRTFQLPPGSVDLVVSSYALHHLRDEDKRTLAAEAARWLRPGGRIVVADMMFGRGATRRDREILRQKATAFAVRGGGGSPRTSPGTDWASATSTRPHRNSGSWRSATPASPTCASSRSSRKPASCPAPAPAPRYRQA
jgi:SAM-dependent methyltransferase